jgi:ribonuclease VapC
MADGVLNSGSFLETEIAVALGPKDAETDRLAREVAALAIEAFRRFGRGRHPAGLNIGDCFAHALARARDEPLLFKGEDFARTDVRPVPV